MGGPMFARTISLPSTLTTRLIIRIAFAFLIVAAGAAGSWSIAGLPPAEANEQVLFADDFDDGDADGWTVLSGDWAVVDGAYVSTDPCDDGSASSETSNRNYSKTIVGDDSWTDYELRFDFMGVDGVDRDVEFRHHNANNFYVQSFPAHQNLWLQRISSSGNTGWLQTGPAEADVWHHVKIIAVGTHIQVFYDGSLLHDVDDVDSTVRSGGVALLSGFGTVCPDTVRYDNVVVIDRSDRGNTAPTIDDAHFKSGGSVACGPNNATLHVEFRDPDDGQDYTASVRWGDGTGQEDLGRVDSPFEATHTYTEAGAYTARVTVNDGEADSDQVEATVTVNFTATSILPPINADGTSVFNGNQTIPIKLQIQDCDDSYPIDLSPTVRVKKVEGTTPGEPVNEEPVAAEPDNGGEMRFDAEANQYVYNFRASSLDDPNATYKAVVTIPATGQQIASAPFGIKAPKKS